MPSHQLNHVRNDPLRGVFRSESIPMNTKGSMEDEEHKSGTQTADTSGAGEVEISAKTIEFD